MPPTLRAWQPPGEHQIVVRLQHGVSAIVAGTATKRSGNTQSCRCCRRWRDPVASGSNNWTQQVRRGRVAHTATAGGDDAATACTPRCCARCRRDAPNIEASACRSAEGGIDTPPPDQRGSGRKFVRRRSRVANPPPSSTCRPVAKSIGRRSHAARADSKRGLLPVPKLVSRHHRAEATVHTLSVASWYAGPLASSLPSPSLISPVGTSLGCPQNGIEAGEGETTATKLWSSLLPSRA